MHKKTYQARATVAPAHELGAGEAVRHQDADPLRQRGEHEEADGRGRVGEHAPDAHLQGELRRQHRGVRRHPGGDARRGAEGQTDVAPGEHVTDEGLAATAPVQAERHPDHGHDGEQPPARLR